MAKKTAPAGEGALEGAVVRNSGHLCSVYCPGCGKVTDKVSFNLLRDAGTVHAVCPMCFRVTVLEYDGKKATLWHRDELEEGARRLLEERKKNSE